MKLQPKMTAAEVITRLQNMANPTALPGMARFGIATTNSLGGISTPKLQKLAREVGKSHDLAEHLWASGIKGIERQAGIELK